MRGFLLQRTRRVWLRPPSGPKTTCPGGLGQLEPSGLYAGTAPAAVRWLQDQQRREAGRLREAVAASTTCSRTSDEMAFNAHAGLPGCGALSRPGSCWPARTTALHEETLQADPRARRFRRRVAAWTWSSAGGRLALAQTNLMTESANLNDVRSASAASTGLDAAEHAGARPAPGRQAAQGSEELQRLAAQQPRLPVEASAAAGRRCRRAVVQGRVLAEVRIRGVERHRYLAARPRLQEHAQHQRAGRACRTTCIAAAPIPARVRRPRPRATPRATCATTPAATCCRTWRSPGTTSCTCASRCPSCATTKWPRPRCATPIANSSRSASARCWTCWIPKTNCSNRAAR